LEKATLAHEQHKAEDTKAGRGGELPGGISNGIAELVSLKIGIYAKGDYEGEPFFMGMATCRSPKVHNGIPTKGLFTTAGPIGLCDTHNAKGEVIPFSENWDRMLRHLRSLGLDTKDLSPHDIIAGIDNEAYETGPVLLALAEAAPTFRFSTNSAAGLEPLKNGKWKVGRKEFTTKEAAIAANPYCENPRVWHEWGDVVEWTEEGTSAVEDDTVQEAKWESDEKAETAAEPVVEEAATKEVESVAVESVDAEELPDFAAFAKIADDPKSKKPDKIAAEKVLSGHAKTLGIEGYEDMPSWAEVAQAIIDMMEIQKAEQAGEQIEAVEAAVEEEEYSEEVEEWVPAKGEIGFFLDPKSKTPVKCEFVEVNGKLEKVDLKRLDTNKIVKGVPFIRLSATAIPF
jgi:hypothetical protein